MIIPVLILGIILRVISLNQSLWLDEAINVLGVRNHSLLYAITTYQVADFHPPGFTIILWLVVKIFGSSEVALRAPSLIFGVLSIAIIYKIGLIIFDKRAALISALVLATNPLHLYYSQEARPYSFATFAVLLSYFYLLSNLKLFSNRLLLVLSLVLVLSSDYLAYFVIVSQLFFIFFFKRSNVKTYLKCLIISLISFSPWGLVFFKQLNNGLNTARFLPQWSQVVGSSSFKSLGLIPIKLLIGRITIDNKIIYGLLVGPLILLWSIVSSFSFKKMTSYNKGLLSSWLFLPLGLSWMFSLFVPILSYFRLLFILPALILIVSNYLAAKNKLSQVILVLIVLAQLFCSVIYLVKPQFHREDWRGLEAYIASRHGILVLENSGTFAPLDYYSQPQVKVVAGLKTIPARTTKDINLDVDQYPHLFLLNYLVDITDNRRILFEHLKSDYQQITVYNFNGVGLLYEYQR